MGEWIKREPVAVRGLLLAVLISALNLALAFGVKITREQLAAVNALAGSVLTLIMSLWTRSLVSPVSEVPAPLPPDQPAP